MNNKLKTIYLTVVLASSFILVSGDVSAAIFKCENVDGATYYNDKPCPVSDKETQMKSTKDPENGYIPPAFVADEIVSEGNNSVMARKNTSSVTNDLSNNNHDKKNGLTNDSNSNQSDNDSTNVNTSTKQSLSNPNSTSSDKSKSTENAPNLVEESNVSAFEYTKSDTIKYPKGIH